MKGRPDARLATPENHFGKFKFLIGPWFPNHP